MIERVARYQHNIRAIRAAGCTVPSAALINSLDPAVIEAWFAEKTEICGRLRMIVRKLSKQPPDALIPSLLALESAP
jgi:hypothetical protein